MSAERRLVQLELELPPAPKPLGAYTAAVHSGRLLFLSGMLPFDGGALRIVGRLGEGVDAAAGRHSARLAALNALAVARQTLGSLDRIARAVRTTLYVATSTDFTAHPAVADGASELLRDVLGPEKLAARTVVGVATLPLGAPVVLDVVFEV